MTTQGTEVALGEATGAVIWRVELGIVIPDWLACSIEFSVPADMRGLSVKDGPAAPVPECCLHLSFGVG